MVPYQGSQAVMGALSMSTRVPPYSGVPRLSHQFPVAVVVAVEVTAAEVVDEGITIVEVVEVDDGVEITVVVVDVAVVEVGVVVDEVQDARTSEPTMRKVSDARRRLFFIQTSFLFLLTSGELSITLCSEKF